MADPVHRPSWRKPAGMLLLLLYIMVWCVGVASLWPLIAAWHWALHALFFGVTGLIWIVPLGPLLRWMETGRWRRPA